VWSIRAILTSRLLLLPYNEKFLNMISILPEVSYWGGGVWHAQVCCDGSQRNVSRSGRLGEGYAYPAQRAVLRADRCLERSDGLPVRWVTGTCCVLSSRRRCHYGRLPFCRDACWHDEGGTDHQDGNGKHWTIARAVWLIRDPMMFRLDVRWRPYVDHLANA
jgi:hypothetical protein